MKAAIARAASTAVALAALAGATFAAGWTDRNEYDLVLVLRAEGTAQKQLALLDQWKARYPQSEQRQVRRELYLAAYHSLGDSAHMLEIAREMLAEQPNNLVGAYWCTVLLPGAKEATPELWSVGEKAARQLLTGVPPGPEWQKQKDSVEALAHRALGWIQWQRGDLAAAEAEFSAILKTDNGNAEVSAWYGMVLVAQKVPEKVAPGLWQLARAGSLKEQGALPDGSRRQVNALAERVYVSYHGDAGGLEQIRTSSVASAAPPADFQLESAAAIAARKAEEDLKRTNPQLAQWMTIRKQLEAADGEKYFAESLRPVALPKLKGTVIRCIPEGKPAEVILGLSNGVAEEVLLKVVGAPLPLAAEAGTEIEFEGMPESYTRNPFQLTVLTDKSKITGWPEKAAGRKQ